MEKCTPTVNCPICGKAVEWRPENQYRPFCSERCKKIDLGAWAAGDYRVPVRGDPSDLPEEPGEPT